MLSDARRSRSTYVDVSWLYGGLLVLLGLVLVLLPFLTIVFLIALVGLYALCDGLYLLAKGLRLRFAPSPFSTPASQASEDLLDLPDELPATTRRAVVFVRRSGEQTDWAYRLGFRVAQWVVHAGSVENPAGKSLPSHQTWDFGAAHTLEPVALMRKQSHPYDAYKLFSVVLPRPKEAWRVVIWEVGSRITSYVTIAMMWPMRSCVPMGRLRFSIRHRSPFPIIGTMLFLEEATRSRIIPSSQCICTRCHSANWQGGDLAHHPTTDHRNCSTLASRRLARVGGINSGVGKNAQRCACAALFSGEACEEEIGMHISPESCCSASILM